MGMVRNWKELGDAGTLTCASSDGSGTTKAFTNSMEAFSKTWTSEQVPVKGPLVSEPRKFRSRRGDQKPVGAIGYVNQSYIKGNVRRLLSRTSRVSSSSLPSPLVPPPSTASPWTRTWLARTPILPPKGPIRLPPSPGCWPTRPATELMPPW